MAVPFAAAPDMLELGLGTTGGSGNRAAHHATGGSGGSPIGTKKATTYDWDNDSKSERCWCRWSSLVSLSLHCAAAVDVAVAVAVDGVATVTSAGRG